MKKLYILVVCILILSSLGCNVPKVTGITPAEPTGVTLLIPSNTPAEATTVVPSSTPVPPTATETPTPVPPVVIPLTIAYLEAGDVYVWRDGGLVTRLTATGDVQGVYLSPDASTVVFKRGADYNFDLWAINTDGSGMRLLFNDASFDALVPGQQNYLNAGVFPPGETAYDFIPGTTNFAFITNYTIEGPGLPTNQDVQIIDYLSGAHTTLLPAGSGAGALDYSPDGLWVALVEGDQIEVMRSDGSDRRVVLTFPFVYTYSEWTYFPDVVWRSDSSGFRVIIPAQDPLGDPTAASQIYEVRTDGSVSGLGSFVGVPVFMSFPTLSPNSEFFAYVCETSPGSNIYEMRVAAADMSYGSVALTGDRLEFIGWSTDNNAYLFWQNSLEILNLGSLGSAPYAFSTTNDLRYVNWVAPQRFLAAYGTGSSRALRLYSLDGSFFILSGFASDVNNYDYAPKP
jgi:hypothetical protein